MWPLIHDFTLKTDDQTFIFLQLTWADIVVANFCEELLKRGGAAVFDKNNVLKSHLEMVLNLPKIKKWIEERPKTFF